MSDVENDPVDDPVDGAVDGPAGEAVEAARVARIAADQVIGRPTRPELSTLAELAAELCAVPHAWIELATGSSQTEIAAVSSPHSDAPETWDFRDFRELVTRDGLVVGALCVGDSGSRELDAEQGDALVLLADRVVDALELRRRSCLLEGAQRELAEALERLGRSGEQIAVFVDQISHDLRNPLTSVSMSLQMLAEQPAVSADAEAAWMVSRALRGTEQMNNMIEDLLRAANANLTVRED